MEKLSTLITLSSVTVTVISVLIALYQIANYSADYVNIGSKRKKALKGNWFGKFKQHNLINGSELSGDMKLTLNSKRKLITGDIDLFQQYFNKHDFLIVKGGMRNERYLILQYRNLNDNIIQFGFMFLEFSSNCKRLSGKIVGYGPESEKIVSADVQFEHS
ncbi:MAG: hypothetical protein WBP41_03865 [Saprospiraceae bacterium]